MVVTPFVASISPLEDAVACRASDVSFVLELSTTMLRAQCSSRYANHYDRSSRRLRTFTVLSDTRWSGDGGFSWCVRTSCLTTNGLCAKGIGKGAATGVALCGILRQRSCENCIEIGQVWAALANRGSWGCEVFPNNCDRVRFLEYWYTCE